MSRFLQCFFITLSLLFGCQCKLDETTEESYRFDQPLKNITKHEQANYTFTILDGDEGDYFPPIWIVNGDWIYNGETKEGSFFSVTANYKTLIIHGNLAPTDKITIRCLVHTFTDLSLNFTHTLFILRSKPEKVHVDCNETNSSLIKCNFSHDYDTYGLESVYNVSVYDSNTMESPIYNNKVTENKLTLNVNPTESEGVYKVLVKLIVNGVNSKMESNITTVTVKMMNLEVDDFELYVSSSPVATVSVSPSLNRTNDVTDQTDLIAIKSIAAITTISIMIVIVIIIIVILPIVFLVATRKLIRKSKTEGDKDKQAERGTKL